MTRFWWDDAFVVAALIFDIFFFVHFWVKYKDSGTWCMSTFSESNTCPRYSLGSSSLPRGFPMVLLVYGVPLQLGGMALKD